MRSEFNQDDFEVISECPWCQSKTFKNWGYQNSDEKFQTVECRKCSLIYVRHRYNASGLSKYYADYLNDIHQNDAVLNMQRQKMYVLEYNLVSRYLKKNSRILDVGCSGGYFLDLFSREGHSCFGVEFGEMAALEAKKKYPVFYGDFPEIDIEGKFDLIIFRGVIEHIAYPKAYLRKACCLLEDSGMVFITSTPNRDSVCCGVFKDSWNQHIPQEHLMHFSPDHFDSFFCDNEYERIEKSFLYEETPYANIQKDILDVAEGIAACREKGRVLKKSPPFYGNMMSLIYRKVPSA